MTHLLRVTDGTNTITLSGGSNNYLRGYDLQSNESGDHADITETVEVTFTNNTNDNIRADVRLLEKLFRRAWEYWNEGTGARCWVEFQPGSSGDIYRSEIKGGVVDPTTHALATGWVGKQWQSRVIWTRRYYWEGPEAALTLTNSSGSGATRTIYNHDDSTAGHDNWVTIDGDDIGGSEPAAAIIKLTNTYATNKAYGIFVSNNVFSNPGSLVHIIEGEDSELGADTADANCSGGYYNTGTWAGDVAAATFRFTLSSTLLNACAGHWFRLLARFQATTGSGVYVQAKLMYPTGTPLTVLQQGPEMLLSQFVTLQEIGSLRIPPWLPGQTGFQPLALVIYARKTGGSSLKLDYIQLTPLDAYRVYIPAGYGIAQNYRLVDDGVLGNVYVDDGSGASKLGYYTANGDPIQLWPGRDNKLTVLAYDDAANNSPIARTWTIAVSYRPRRLTL